MNSNSIEFSTWVKMKPIKTNQQVLTWLCVCQADETISKRKRMAHIFFASFIFSANFILIPISVAYFLRFVSVDLEQALYALFQLSGMLGMTYMMIAAFILRHEINDLFGKLADIYNNYKEEESYRYLEQTNNICEFIWKLYFGIGMIGFLFNSMSMTAISLIYCWLTSGGFDAKYAYRTYKTILPWNQTTPVGYFWAASLDFCIAEAYLVANGALLLLFISLCLHHQAFYKMFKHKLCTLEIEDENRNNEQFLSELIQFQTNVKSWFMESANIYRHFILVQLICSMIFLACVVFQLDLQSQHPDYNVLVLIISFAVSAGNLFLYCYFGIVATESYENFADSLYDANWLKLPSNIQKYFILMILNAQKSLYYHGFGVAVLNLETFTKMVRAVFSYYMLLKTLTE